MDASQSPQGINIPNDLSNIQTSAKLVVVIEKDAVFQRLMWQNFLRDLGSPAILITGKGFPDMNTRKMLRKLAYEVLPTEAKFVCLVDGDPHGIEILSVYKYGSRALAFCDEPLAVPKLNWIGIHPSEAFDLASDDSIQECTKEDLRKAKNLQKREYFEQKIQDELNFIVDSKKKISLAHILKSTNEFINYSVFLKTKI